MNDIRDVDIIEEVFLVPEPMRRRNHMKGYLFGIFLLLLVWAVAATNSVVPHPYVEPAHLTRGISRDALNVSWQLEQIEARREKETSLIYLAWLQIQEPIHMDGAIPLWGVVCAVGAFAYSFIYLLIWAKSHDREDKDRFKAIDVRFQQLKETIDEHHEELKIIVRGKGRTL